jgi:DnaJ-class molecular chaperone
MASHAPSVSALRVHLANAAARAVDGSYFEILGVPSDADGDVIERAHDRLARELAALDLAAVGLPGLERDRERVLAAVDEAYAALRSARLRRAYAAALAAPEVGR